MRDSCGAPGLTPFAEALNHLLAQISVKTDFHWLPIEQACDAILAQNIASQLNIPSADNSAMVEICFENAGLCRVLNSETNFQR